VANGPSFQAATNGPALRTNADGALLAKGDGSCVPCCGRCFHVISGFFLLDKPSSSTASHTITAVELEPYLDDGLGGTVASRDVCVNVSRSITIDPAFYTSGQVLDFGTVGIQIVVKKNATTVLDTGCIWTIFAGDPFGTGGHVPVSSSGQTLCDLNVTVSLAASDTITIEATTGCLDRLPPYPPDNQFIINYGVRCGPCSCEGDPTIDPEPNPCDACEIVSPAEECPSCAEVTPQVRSASFTGHTTATSCEDNGSLSRKGTGNSLDGGHSADKDLVEGACVWRSTIDPSFGVLVNEYSDAACTNDETPIQFYLTITQIGEVVHVLVANDDGTVKLFEGSAHADSCCEDVEVTNELEAGDVAYGVHGYEGVATVTPCELTNYPCSGNPPSAECELLNVSISGSNGCFSVGNTDGDGIMLGGGSQSWNGQSEGDPGVFLQWNLACIGDEWILEIEGNVGELAIFTSPNLGPGDCPTFGTWIFDDDASTGLLCDGSGIGISVSYTGGGGEEFMFFFSGGE
jgi:hypothetical protein